MAVTVDNRGSFGSRTSVVESDGMIYTICTAKEGLFKGLSTVIIEGKITGELKAKILYKNS